MFAIINYLNKVFCKYFNNKPKVNTYITLKLTYQNECICQAKHGLNIEFS